MRIALHFLVDVDADRWAAEHGIERRDVRVHVRRQVAAELLNLRVPLVPVPVDKPSPAPPPAPAPAARPLAAGPERAPDSRPAIADPAGTTTPIRAATSSPGVGVRDAQPAGATAPRERVSAARPADGNTPAPAPAARAGSTTGRPVSPLRQHRDSGGMWWDCTRCGTAWSIPQIHICAAPDSRPGPAAVSPGAGPARDAGATAVRQPTPAGTSGQPPADASASRPIAGASPTGDVSRPPSSAPVALAGTHHEPAVASRHTVPALAAPHPGSPGTSGRPEPGTLRPAAPGPDRLLTGPARAAGGYLERIDQHPAHPRNRRRLLAAVVALIVALVLAAATAGPGPAGPPAPPRPAPAPTAASRRTPPLPTPAPQPDIAWMASAACKGQDLAEFYPGPGQPARGRRWCRGCTVRLDCLDWVMAVEPTYGRHGLWGGLIPQEREDIAAAWRQAGGLS